jgi:hypothetical protein
MEIFLAISVWSNGYFQGFVCVTGICDGVDALLSEMSISMLGKGRPLYFPRHSLCGEKRMYII